MICFVLFFYNCASQGNVQSSSAYRETAGTNQSENRKSADSGNTPKNNNSSREIEDLIKNAKQEKANLDIGKALLYYSRALEIITAANDRSLKKYDDQINQAIFEIEKNLKIEPGSKWMDKKTGESVKVDPTMIDSGNFIQPYLTLVYDDQFSGGNLVEKVPVRFSFIEGQGSLNQDSATDANGSISARISKFQANADFIYTIQAQVYLPSEKLKKPLSNVVTLFHYAPQAKTAVVVVRTLSIDKKIEDAYFIPVIQKYFKKYNIVIKMIDTALIPDLAKNAFLGDEESMEEIAKKKKSNYLFLLDVKTVQGSKIQGILMSRGYIKFNIFRVADKKIVYSQEMKSKGADDDDIYQASERTMKAGAGDLLELLNETTDSLIQDMKLAVKKD